MNGDNEIWRNVPDCPLTLEDALSIIRCHDGIRGTRVALARAYGASSSTISNIWNGRTHKDLYEFGEREGGEHA
jgi:hypothetical protein